MADDFQVLPYEPKHAGEWDEMVGRSQNGTIYHTRRFLAYHPPSRFSDASLMIREGGSLVGVLPATRDTHDGVDRLRSHPGATYGGLICPRGERLHRINGMVAALVAHARAQGVRRMEMLRLTPKPYCAVPSDEHEMALHLNGFSVIRRELTCGLGIKGAPETLLSPQTMWSVRRAEREGVVAEFSDDWAAFWPVLEKALSSRHGARPTHSLQEIQNLKQLCGEDISLLLARKGDRIASGMAVFSCNSRAIYTMYMAMDYEFSKLQPNYLCLCKLIDWGAERGYEFLDIGVCTEGSSINWGLYAFKEKFGCHGYFRVSYGRDV